MVTPAEGPPTIETIAARAGVSIASVSRVLNGHGGRPDTVRKVTDAAHELGYVPNSVARSLQSRKTMQVTFAMPDIGNPVYVAMTKRIQAVVSGAGYRLLVHCTDADTAAELAALRGLAERHTDGLILCALRVTDAHLSALAGSAAPVVVIGSPPDDVPVDTVRVDSRIGAGLAVDHLHAAGRRRIALLNGPADTVPGASRLAGYRAGLRDCGLAEDPALVVTTEFQVDAGADAAATLLALAPDVDAIFCANDLIAVGALRALRAAGRTVPGDVAVVGMDDTDLARACWPPLTSVDLGSAERGGIAAKLLLDRLTTDGDIAARRISVQPRLAVRDSSGVAAVGDGGR